MSQESDYLPQKAVLLAATGYGDYGEATTAAAVEIDVRWEEKKSEVLDNDGNTVRVDATVVVDRDVAVGSVMWLGLLEDFAAPYSRLKEVVVFSKIPDVKGREFRRTVSLIRYKDRLPATT